MNKELIKELELLRFYKEKGCLDTHYKVLIDYIDKLEQENEKLNNKIDISIGILKTWKDFCEVKRKYCVGKDKEHWTYCIEKLEGLEDVLKDSDVDD